MAKNDLIIAGLVLGAIWFLTQNKSNVSTGGSGNIPYNDQTGEIIYEREDMSKNQIEKSNQRTIIYSDGTTQTYNVPEGGNIKVVGNTTYVYRKDGTLQAEYTKSNQTWKEKEEQQKAQIKESGPITEKINFNTSDKNGNVVQKSGNFVSWIGANGKVKMGYADSPETKRLMQKDGVKL